MSVDREGLEKLVIKLEAAIASLEIIGYDSDAEGLRDVKRALLAAGTEGPGK